MAELEFEDSKVTVIAARGCDNTNYEIGNCIEFASWVMIQPITFAESMLDSQLTIRIFADDELFDYIKNSLLLPNKPGVYKLHCLLNGWSDNGVYGPEGEPPDEDLSLTFVSAEIVYDPSQEEVKHD